MGPGFFGLLCAFILALLLWFRTGVISTTRRIVEEIVEYTVNRIIKNVIVGIAYATVTLFVMELAYIAVFHWFLSTILYSFLKWQWLHVFAIQDWNAFLAFNGALFGAPIQLLKILANVCVLLFSGFAHNDFIRLAKPNEWYLAIPYAAAYAIYAEFILMSITDWENRRFPGTVERWIFYIVFYLIVCFPLAYWYTTNFVPIKPDALTEWFGGMVNGLTTTQVPTAASPVMNGVQTMTQPEFLSAPRSAKGGGHGWMFYGIWIAILGGLGFVIYKFVVPRLRGRGIAIPAGVQNLAARARARMSGNGSNGSNGSTAFNMDAFKAIYNRANAAQADYPEWAADRAALLAGASNLANPAMATDLVAAKDAQFASPQAPPPPPPPTAPPPDVVAAATRLEADLHRTDITPTEFPRVQADFALIQGHAQYTALVAQLSAKFRG